MGAASRKNDKQPPLKKKRIDTTGDWTTSDGLDFDLEVYGQTDIAPTTHRSVLKYTTSCGRGFEFCPMLD